MGLLFGVSPLLALPNEIRYNIIKCLEVEDVASLSLTSKDLHDVAATELQRHRGWGSMLISKHGEIYFDMAPADGIPRVASHRNHRHPHTLLQQLLCHSQDGLYVRSLIIEDYGLSRPSSHSFHRTGHNWAIHSISQISRGNMIGEVFQAPNRPRFESCEAKDFMRRLSGEETFIMTTIISRLPMLRSLCLSSFRSNESWDAEQFPYLRAFLSHAASSGTLSSHVFPHLVELRLQQSRGGVRGERTSLVEFMSVFARLPTLNLLHGYGVLGHRRGTTDKPLHTWRYLPGRTSTVESLEIYMADGEDIDFNLLVKICGLRYVMLDMMYVNPRQPRDLGLIDDLTRWHSGSLEHLHLTSELYDRRPRRANMSLHTLKHLIVLRTVVLDFLFFWWWLRGGKYETEYEGTHAEDPDVPINEIFPTSIEDITLCGKTYVHVIGRVVKGVEKTKVQKLQRLRCLKFMSDQFRYLKPYVEDYIKRCKTVGVEMVVGPWGAH